MGCNLFGGFGCNRRNIRDELPRRRFCPPRRDLNPGWEFRDDFHDRRCPRCRSTFPRLF